MEEKVEIIIQKLHKNKFISLIYTNSIMPEFQFCGNLNEVTEKLKEWEDYIINYLDKNYDKKNSTNNTRDSNNNNVDQYYH